jgi:crotonobetainyl-CoA:carnitine CoA-transferase CaiB-like acyl-CoA transferase
MNGFIHAYTDGALIRREAFGAPHPRYPVPSLYRCADGYIMALIGARPGLAGYLAWAREEGVTPPPSLADLTHEDLDSGPAIFARRPGFADVVTEFLADFFAARTRAELAAGALRRRMLFATVNTLADFADDEQLTARGYVTDVTGPDGKTLGYPTYWARLSRTPLVATGAPPAAGADNATILGQEEIT